MLRSTSFSSRQIPQPPPAHLSPTAVSGRGLSNANLPRARGGNPNGQQQQSQQPAPILAADLTFAETNQVRAVWAHSGKEYLRDAYSLRLLLGELGLYPTDDEMTEVLATFDSKVSFNGFLRYVTYLKTEHAAAAANSASSAAAAAEMDTARAFVALGGEEDRSGSVCLERLRDACQRFTLTIDVDAMVAAAAVDPSNGAVNYAEFKRMWELRHQAGATTHAAAGGASSTSAASGSGDGNSSSASRHNSKDGGAAAPRPLAGFPAASLSAAGGGAAPTPPQRKAAAPRRNYSSASAEDEDLALMLVTGYEGGADDADASADPYVNEGGEAAQSLVFGGAVESGANTPRSVLRSLGSITAPAGGSYPSSPSSAPLSPSQRFAALRNFLLDIEPRRGVGAASDGTQQRRRSNSLGTSSGPAGTGGKRGTVTRRYTTLPPIRPGGIMANAAAAELAALEGEEDGDEVDNNAMSMGAGGKQHLFGMSSVRPVGGADGAAAGGQQAAGGGQQQQREEKVGYRAPSPMILSEYTASRHRPEGNKLGLISPRGATSKGSSMGMTKGSSSSTTSPHKKSATNSPRRQK